MFQRLKGSNSLHFQGPDFVLLTVRALQSQQVFHIIMAVLTRFMAATYWKYICSSGVLELLCEHDITHCQQNLIMTISMLRVPP